MQDHLNNPFILFNQEEQRLYCKGQWDINHLLSIQATLKKIPWPSTGNFYLDGDSLSSMDTAGAWLLSSLITKSKKQGLVVHLQHFSTATNTLISLIEKQVVDEENIPTTPKQHWITHLGKIVSQQSQAFQHYLAFVGQAAIEALRWIAHPQKIRWNAILSVIDKNGYMALPIIALLSFMIGMVIAYQMGNQLLTYGANIFIVNLLGLSILREFGPLLTAIMVAGRTGSAFTAELGIMKINQEIDALITMGITPYQLLLVPRIIGLAIALPLLTMWADLFGIIGGMVMAKNMLSITWYEFLIRFQHEIPLRALLIGLGKAPLFALIIASIGCFQGIQVKQTADSLGKNTTSSVVWGIFFIIVADAILSIIFSRLKL